MKRQHENAEHLVGLKKTVDKENFFTDNNPTSGYTSKETFLHEISLLPDYLLRDLKFIFTSLKERKDMRRQSTYEWENQTSGIKCYKVTVGSRRFSTEVTLPMLTGMEMLLKEYQSNLVNIDLDLDDLIMASYPG